MGMMEYYERKQEYNNKNMNKRTCQREDNMVITIQENELYREIELYHDNIKYIVKEKNN
jgi:hypothetical protein